jgi:DNA-binding NtrC family response regulator
MGKLIELPNTLPATVEHLSDTMIAQALKACDGNKSAAARMLGLRRTTLIEMLKRRPAKETTDRVVLIRVIGSQPKRVKIEIED